MAQKNACEITPKERPQEVKDLLNRALKAKNSVTDPEIKKQIGEAIFELNFAIDVGTEEDKKIASQQLREVLPDEVHELLLDIKDIIEPQAEEQQKNWSFTQGAIKRIQQLQETAELLPKESRQRLAALQKELEYSPETNIDLENTRWNDDFNQLSTEMTAALVERVESLKTLVEQKIEELNEHPLPDHIKRQIKTIEKTQTAREIYPILKDLNTELVELIKAREVIDDELDLDNLLTKTKTKFTNEIIPKLTIIERYEAQMNPRELLIFNNLKESVIKLVEGTYKPETIEEINLLNTEVNNIVETFMLRIPAADKALHAAREKRILTQENTTKNTQPNQNKNAPEAEPSSPQTPTTPSTKQNSWLGNTKFGRRLAAAAVAIATFFGGIKNPQDQMQQELDNRPQISANANKINGLLDVVEQPNSVTAEKTIDKTSTPVPDTTPGDSTAELTESTTQLLSVVRAVEGDSFIRIMDRFLADSDNKQDVISSIRGNNDNKDKTDATLIREWRNQQLSNNGIEWKTDNSAKKLAYTKNILTAGDRFSLVEENGKISIEWEKSSEINDTEQAEIEASARSENTPAPGTKIGDTEFYYGENFLIPNKDGIYSQYKITQGNNENSLNAEGSRVVAGTDAEIPDIQNINEGNVDSVKRGYMLGTFAVQPLPGDGYRIQFTQQDGKGIINALAVLLEREMNMGLSDAIKQANKIVKTQKDIVNMRTLSTEKTPPNKVKPGDFVNFKHTKNGWVIESVETGLTK